MAKKRKRAKPPQIPLDTTIKKRRGRPGVRRTLITGRAYNYQLLLEQCWDDDKVGERLLTATTPEDVTQAFDEAPQHLKQNFVSGHSALILRIIRDKRYPAKRESRIRFIADSLAGEGHLSPRRSRDICAEERARTVYKIMRREYYVECTCGYKGPALNDACKKCGAKISALPARIDWTLMP
jgi:hypothetical protein